VPGAISAAVWEPVPVMSRGVAIGIAGAVIAFGAGCGGPAARQQQAPAGAPATAAAAARPAASAPGGSPGGSTRPPALLPAFSARVSGPLTARDVPFSWHPGCPVPPSALRAIDVSYVGFDARAHTGVIIVNARVAGQVIKVFAILYRARFPIAAMRPADAYQGSDPRSMAADNTSGFNCRPAVAAGPPHWSMHAYGLAIDVNTVQNPYAEPGSGWQPPAGAGYADRSHVRPGMAYRGGVLVSAFRSAGWGWGGDWPNFPDYQHFSVNGR
jgi:D-alanyl-D-alanine carboxypeptidase